MTAPALANAIVWRGEPENGRTARLHADGTLIPAWGNPRSEQNAQRQVNRAFAALLAPAAPAPVTRPDSVGEPLADGTASWEVRPLLGVPPRQEWSTFEPPAAIHTDDAELAAYNAGPVEEPELPAFLAAIPDPVPGSDVNPCDPEMHKVNGFCGACCDGNL